MKLVEMKFKCLWNFYCAMQKTSIVMWRTFMLKLTILLKNFEIYLYLFLDGGCENFN